MDWRALGIVRHLHFSEVASTNDEGRQAAVLPSYSEDFPLLITCDRQTSGRGRSGRSWWQGEGGLAFSIVTSGRLFGLPATANLNQLTSQLSIWTAICLQGTAASYLPLQACRVKWPNDLMIDNRKNAGILIEAVPGKTSLAVVGIGVNINNPVHSAAVLANVEAFSWSETGGRFDLPFVVSEFLRRWLPVANAPPTMPELIRRYREVDWLHDRSIEVHANGAWRSTPNGQVEVVANSEPTESPSIYQGKYSGLTADGFLQLTDVKGVAWVFPSAERVRALS
ncbi:MAG: biotin--[acetyl-CoA-carboxylase] ligase [Planctomycetaceae bacterium]|nr:biotin--[acetyl-CoA-carboxylase] ligase [Planctomycetaceae bacterium]